MEFPKELKYTKDHEWVRVEDDIAIVGITEFAQSELGELVFVDLPATGKELKQGETLCVVESTKAASDVYSPVPGIVSESNSNLTSDPALINKDPYVKGWIAKLSDFKLPEDSKLMTADEYTKFVGSKS